MVERAVEVTLLILGGTLNGDHAERVLPCFGSCGCYGVEIKSFDFGINVSGSVYCADWGDTHHSHQRIAGIVESEHGGMSVAYDLSIGERAGEAGCEIHMMSVDPAVGYAYAGDLIVGCAADLRFQHFLIGKRMVEIDDHCCRFILGESVAVHAGMGCSGQLSEYILIVELDAVIAGTGCLAGVREGSGAIVCRL